MSEKYFQNTLDEMDPVLKAWDFRKAPLLFFLKGPLGAGKTTFVQEFISRFSQSADTVQSPTFLKVLEYKSKNFGKIIHMDTYRMEDLDSFHSLGLEFLLQAKIWFVEWPELFCEFLKINPQVLSLLDFRECLDVEIKVDPIHGSLGGGENMNNRTVLWARKSIKEMLS